MSRANTPEFRINTADRAYTLGKGAYIAFGPEQQADSQTLFLTAACACAGLDGSVLCINILPGVDMCANIQVDNEAELLALWPGVEQFMQDWIESDDGQTQHLWSQHRKNWVCLCRHGAEKFDDVVLTIERIWPSGVARTPLSSKV